MKINKIELENFKFHQALDFEIINKNCLIYGENGVGKSSIYWALLSIFRKDLINIEKFKNRNMREDDEVNVKVTLDSQNFFTLNNESPFLDNNQEKIFFTHQDMLEEFLLHSENFYDILNSKIRLYFKNIEVFSSSLHQFDSDTNETNHEGQTPLRKAVTNKYELFLNQLLSMVNDIINRNFEENFTIKFEYDWGRLDLERGYKYITPKISLLIENESKLKLHFNEAKLKLVSIAIFFALIKLEEKEQEDNSLKLLVLDDFLTSLDMANRELIVQYILDNFEDYQKIILTHNIQFYNLIVRLLKMRDEEDSWDIKNIFLFDNNKAIIKDKNENYLKYARNKLIEGEYHQSGNYARKEFERITNEFKQILEIGKTEQLNQVLKMLKSKNDEDTFYKKPFSLLSKLNDRYINISNILDNDDEINAKIGKINFEIKQIQETLKTEECELFGLKELLIKIEFYKNILFNPASHNSEDIEVYRKECLTSIRLLKELNSVLDSLK